MADSIKQAVDTLRAKARELIEEREGLRRRLLEDAIRDVVIDRDLGGCVAGAKALGHDIDATSKIVIPPTKQQQFQAFMAGRQQIANTFPHLKTEFGILDDDAEIPDAEISARQEMPRIADIILEQLKSAGEDGCRAADIRRYILRTYNADIHDKTVGMTLYRMKGDNLVRLEGHTWFLASPEAANPDAATPGPINPQT